MAMSGWFAGNTRRRISSACVSSRSAGVEILARRERGKGEQRSRSLLVLVAIHATMPVERLLEKTAGS